VDEETECVGPTEKRREMEVREEHFSVLIFGYFLYQDKKEQSEEGSTSRRNFSLISKIICYAFVFMIVSQDTKRDTGTRACRPV
jgi:hypothetical protein